MKTTGIYGGSFNPIHTGHITLGQALVEQGLLQELWFMVSPQNPLKRDQALLSDQTRLSMALLALAGKPNLRASDFEFHLPRPSYMVNTLTALRHEFPDREFVLVIGADNWACFSQWFQSQEILRHHRLIVYPRPGYELENIPERVTVARTPLLPISSTQIRQAIQQGEYNGEGLPPAVWNEIKEKGYYRHEN